MKSERMKVCGDLIVVGGGLAGICCAVAAARNGVDTVLVQDRPMPGGNASSEIRMWICGSRVAEFREGGIVEELKLANYHYNPTLKYTLWDQVMRDCLESAGVRCYFSTSIHQVRCEDDRIVMVAGWGLTDYLEYEFVGRYYADCSGDSILALSGARCQRGRESRAAHGESWGQEEADQRTMGSSILMQLRRTPSARPFKAPAWAYHYDDATVPRPEAAFPGDNFWWLEFGGVKDCIGDARAIGRELQRIVLGYWEYISNHPDGRGEGWSLDWVGSLPGKRESRRYVGDYLLTQTDVESQAAFADAVSFGGWSLDDHDPEAIHTRNPPNRNRPVRQGYPIPFRCLYSVNVRNLLFAGRNISVTHLALSATRVMATCGTLGQAVGTAVSLCCEHSCDPANLGKAHIHDLQQRLLLQDQFIPGIRRELGRAASSGIVSDPRLRDGVERDSSEGIAAHAVELQPGDSCWYRFAQPMPVSGARIIWDSHFADSKRMRCDEGEDMTCSVPATIGRRWSVELLTGGEWHSVWREGDNYRRLNLMRWPSVAAEGVRLTLSGQAGKAARVFAFEPLD